MRAPVTYRQKRTTSSVSLSPHRPEVVSRFLDEEIMPLDARRFLITMRGGDSVAATPGCLCGLHISIDRPRLLSDLQGFLRDVGFIAAHRRGEGLDVSIPGSPDTPQAERVVRVYLSIWQAIHPGVQTSVAKHAAGASGRRAGAAH